MIISEENVGEILVLPKTGMLIRIDAVDGSRIFYSQENGERFVSHECQLDAHKVYDSVSVIAFGENIMIGRCLAAAERSALRKLCSADCPDFDTAQAAGILNAIKKQQNHLNSRIRAESPTQVKRQPSLNDIISRAEEKRLSKSKSFSPSRDALTR